MAGGLITTKVMVASAWIMAVLLASASLTAATLNDAGADSVVVVAAADQRPGVVRPSRIGEGCAGAEDIVINQVNATSLPGGVPAYKVDVMNECTGDAQECAIGGIHVRCGFFSSVSLVDAWTVDPRKFRRLHHDDCLVNDGQPLLGGDSISFEYANSFSYNLPVSAATCVHP